MNGFELQFLSLNKQIMFSSHRFDDRLPVYNGKSGSITLPASKIKTNNSKFLCASRFINILVLYFMIYKYIKIYVGLLQGEIISQILFLLFLADLETFLQINADAGITLEQISIYLLMFADDAVIFSETVEGLQTSIDNLRQYCDKWNLTVNISKTKIVVFGKGGPLSQQERWTYGN